MRLIINLILIALIALFGYLVVNSIREPIAFNTVREKRKDAVVERLGKIRDAQKLYRSITGEFAPSFDTLAQVLTEGRFTEISVTGDPDDPQGNTEITYDTTFIAAKDSVYKVINMSVDSLQFVPYTNFSKKFVVTADTITYQQTLVPVVQVRTQYKDFMGKYADPAYSKYKSNYDPNSFIGFGDMNKPNLSGSWDR